MRRLVIGLSTDTVKPLHNGRLSRLQKLSNVERCPAKRGSVQNIVPEQCNVLWIGEVRIKPISQNLFFSLHIYSLSSFQSWCTCNCDNRESKNDDDNVDDWLWWKQVELNSHRQQLPCIPHCSVSLSCEYPPSCHRQLRALNTKDGLNTTVTDSAVSSTTTWYNYVNQLNVVFML